MIIDKEKSNFDLIEFGGIRYPVVTRKKGGIRIDECPYCGERHSHGGLGHHFAPCLGKKGVPKSITINGYVIDQSLGYFIKEYNSL